LPNTLRKLVALCVPNTITPVHLLANEPTANHRSNFTTLDASMSWQKPMATESVTNIHQIVGGLFA
jgi:hypothetical protein